jgi:hypothetical protein
MSFNDSFVENCAMRVMWSKLRGAFGGPPATEARVCGVAVTPAPISPLGAFGSRVLGINGVESRTSAGTDRSRPVSRPRSSNRTCRSFKVSSILGITLRVPAGACVVSAAQNHDVIGIVHELGLETALRPLKIGSCTSWLAGGCCDAVDHKRLF